MADNEVVLAEGCNPELDETFTVARYNNTGFLWEQRVPGRDAEKTWDSGNCEHRTLEAAVNAVVEPWVIEALGIDRAAKLAIETGLVLHTGVEIEEDEEDSAEDEDEEDLVAERCAAELATSLS